MATDGPRPDKMEGHRKLEETLAIVKPDAFDHAEEIEELILGQGFQIVQRKEVTLTRDEAAAFYAEHEGKPFYEGLVEFMTSGPIVVMALARKNAVKHWRTLLGPTNTAVAKEERPDSIRAKFGSDGTRNAAHGSDSTESANRELQFFFPELTLNEVLEGERRDNYLDESLNPILMKGLYAVSKERPENPVAWLADWLLANNPGQASS